MQDILEKKSIQYLFVSDFESKGDDLLKENSPQLKDIRSGAFEQFRKSGIPTKSNEKWKYTNVNSIFQTPFIQQLTPPNLSLELRDIFKCDVPQLDTDLILLVNGWYPDKDQPLKKFPNGVVYGSFAEACKIYPKLVEKHYNVTAKADNDFFTSLNTAYASDGIFIYVPDNIVVEKPLQIIYIVTSPDDIINHHRNLFILGKNSRLNIIVCDHSLYFNKSFTNSVTEISLGENANLDICKIQNSSNNTSQIASVYTEQMANSVFNSNITTLHGGFVRNNIVVKLIGEGCESNVFGIYFTDGQQHIDNNVFIDHASPHCTSNTRYKGVLDDKATGVFSGKVLVQKNSQKTLAYQSNNNILLSDEATINSKPQLEIYADDVKCSHGATFGQLDPEAMFYLRSRGISFEESRMLLMYAFASEVINQIKILPLRERIDNLVSKRLRGELSRCNHCAIKCG